MEITLALQPHSNKIYEVYSLKLLILLSDHKSRVTHQKKKKKLSEFPSFVPPGWDSNNGNPLSRYGVPH